MLCDFIGNVPLRLRKAFFAFGTVLAMALLVVQPSYAAEIVPLDHIDRGFAFNFTMAGKELWCKEWGTKGNTTSMYLRVTEVTNKGAYVRCNAVNAYTGVKIKDCTQGTPVARRTGEFEVYNSVYEDGYRASRLSALAVGSGKTKFYGAFSPDCVGHFTPLV